MSRVVDKAVRLPITVKVSYASGAYNTAAVLGQRASSTSSAEAAISRLTEKLCECLKLHADALAAQPQAAKGLAAGVSMWRIDVAACKAFGPEALKTAGYSTGHSGAPGERRCARCSNCQPAPEYRMGLSKHDRQCSRFGAKVKTHGCCSAFALADQAGDDDVGDESGHHHSRGGDLG